MNSKTGLSIVIPVYNAEHYIAECLESLLSQVRRDIEIVCVDDGSTDGSLSLLNDFSKKDSRVKVFHEENAGVSAARNRGISEASLEYICFVDADDVVSQGMVQTTLEAAEKHDADAVIFGGQTFPNHIKWAEDHLTPKGRLYRFDCWRVLFEEPASRPFGFNKIFRRNILLNRVEFDRNIKIGEDQTFLFDALSLCNKIVCIKDKFYNYRMHAESAMAKAINDINYKVGEHKKIISHVLSTWKKNGWLNGDRAKLLSEWIVTFLDYDLMACGFDFRKEMYRFALDSVDGICSRSDLSEHVVRLLSYMEKVIKSEWKPLVSVIMPVYNAASYLNETLPCLLRQTFTDFEMIFVDDGSADDSVRILNEFSAKDSRASVLKQEHLFAGAARNLGISHARGDYLLFLDSDDFFAPNMLEKSYNRIVETNADICVFRSDAFDQRTGKKRGMEWTCRPEKCALDENGCFSKNTNSKHIYDFTTPAPWNKLIKKSFVLENGLEFQRTRSANDMAFIMTSLALASKITAISDTLLTYRVNNAASLQGSQHKKPDAFYDAIKELKARLVKYGVYEAVKEAFINFSLDFCFYNLGTLRDFHSYQEIHTLITNEALDFIEARGKKQGYFYAYPSNRIYEKMQDIQRLSVIDYAVKWNPTVFEQTEFYRALQSQMQKKIEDLKNSRTWKAGRIVTFFPRKIRGAFRYLRKMGFLKTLKHAVKEIKRYLGFVMHKGDKK